MPEESLTFKAAVVLSEVEPITIKFPVGSIVRSVEESVLVIVFVPAPNTNVPESESKVRDELPPDDIVRAPEEERVSVVRVVVFPVITEVPT